MVSKTKKDESIVEKIEDNVEETLEKVAEKVGDFVEDVVEGKEKKKTKAAKKEEAKEVKKNLTDEEVKNAEAESLATETVKKEAKSLEEKKKALLEKAAKLKEKVEKGEIKTEELKEKVKSKKKTDTLLPLEDYVKSGIYLGTRVVTPNMKQYVYRRRADGLAILNTDTIDEKLKEGIEYLSKFNPQDIIVICKRQAGWKVVEKFSQLTGIRAFTKKYPAGILTNTDLPDFFENELTIITDSWIDKNALSDTLKVHKKILMIADTNNFIDGANKIIIGNNKSQKSLGVIFYLLAKGYCKARGLETEKEIPDLEWWTGEYEERKIAVKATIKGGAKLGV